MASKIVLDLSHFKHVKSDANSTTLQHKKDGHTITLAHQSLNPENQAQLAALSKIPKDYAQSVDKNLAKGGKVKPSKMADGGNVADTDPQAPQAPDGLSPDQKPVPSTIQEATTPDLNAKMDHFGRVKSMMDSLQISPVDMQSYLNHYNPAGAVGSVGAIGNEMEDMAPAAKEAIGEAMGSTAAAQEASEAQAMSNPNTPKPGQGVQIKPGNNTVSNLPRDNMNGMTAPRPPAIKPNNGRVIMLAEGGGVDDSDSQPSPTSTPMPTRTPDPDDSDSDASNNAVAPQAPVPQPAPAPDSQLNSAPQAPPPQNPNQPGAPSQPQATGLPKMDDVEGGINKGFQTQEAGIQQAAKATADTAVAQSKILDDQVKAQSDAKLAFQQQFQALDQERQAHIADIQNGYIDPNQYWHGDANGNGGHSKIAAGIGMILAGFNPTNNPNAAINMLKYQMDQNIDAQKANLGAKQNLLSANLHQFGNLRDATDMTRMMQNDIVTHQLQAAAAKSGSQMAQAQAMQAIGPLQRENAQMQQQFAMRRAMMGLANNPNGNPDAVAQMIGYARVTNPEMAKEMESRYVPGVGMAQVPIPEKARDELKAHVDFDNAAKDLQQWTQNHTTVVPGTADYNTGVQKALNMQALIREGQLGTVYREGEQPLLDKMIKGNPANLLKSFNTEPQLRELIRSNSARMATTARTYGLPVQQQAPQYKIVNGVKYMRGPNGQAIKVPGN